jgi:hypothetical protein
VAAGPISLVAWWDGSVFAIERDLSIPGGDFITEMTTPTPCWRLITIKANGHREVLLDALLADPILLIADQAGIVVGDRHRAHVRAKTGAWRVVNGVDWPSGLAAEANVAATHDCVVFAQLRRPQDGPAYMRVGRLDRTTCTIEVLPELPSSSAVGIVGDSLVWVPNDIHDVLAPNLRCRPLRRGPVSRVVLPSRATQLAALDGALIAVLEHGLAVVQNGVPELRFPEHRFVQVWPRSNDPWFALLGGYEVVRDGDTKRVGSCLCRIRANAVEPIWAETPPALGEDFEIGRPMSVAFGDERVYISHRGALLAVDPDGPTVEPEVVVGASA